MLTWVRAGPDPAAELRAELDDVLAGLAAEAGDCDPDDGWYPDTSDLEDLLDEVEDLAGEAPEAARELAGHAAARISEVLAAGNCLTDDLADTLTRAEELRGDAALHGRAQQRGAEPEAGPGPGVPGLLPLPLGAGPDDRRALQPVQLAGRPLHHAECHGQPGRGLRPQRGVGRLSLQAVVGDGVSRAGTPARIWRGVHTRPLCRGAGGNAVGSSPGQYPVSSAYSIRASATVSAATGSSASVPLVPVPPGTVPKSAASRPRPVILRPLALSQRTECGVSRRCGRPARCATAIASAASAIIAAARAGCGSAGKGPDSTRSSRCVPGVHSVTMYGHCPSKSVS